MNRLLALLLPVLAIACMKDEPRAPAAPAAAPEPPALATPVRVEVWHDTVCPWCRIGLHGLNVAIAGLAEPPVEVVHHPFLLDPTTPAEGRDLREHLGAKVGGVERVEAMFERLEQVGEGFGVRFDWASVRKSPATAASHALIEWAPDAKRTAVIDAVQRAYFEQGRDIGDPAVLAAIAREQGLDEAAARAAVTDPERLADVRRKSEEAGRAGVQSVPRFVIGGRVLSGAQSPDALRDAIVAAAAAATP